MKQINLFYLAAPTYGGWPTFTAHLYRAFSKAGFAVALYKVANTFESKTRLFTGDVPYRNVPEAGLREFASAVSKAGPIVITAVDKKHYHLADQLLSIKGAAIVIHDPTEINDTTRAILAGNPDCKIVTIRRAVQKHLPFRTTFIRHPYVRVGGNFGGVRKRAVSISRLDWDKHIDIIAAANEMLPDKLRVDIYGAENRLYTNHKLTGLWRQKYKGAFPRQFHSAVQLAREYDYVVDMSVIKGDGGGTQYTFLEAWDARACLIINSDWYLPDDDMLPGINCLSVKDPRLLADALQVGPPAEVVEMGERCLRLHDPVKIAGYFADLLAT